MREEFLNDGELQEGGEDLQPAGKPLPVTTGAVLFMRAGRIACRHCQQVAYGSQSADLIDRTWRKEAQAEARLGPNGTRPKGMHAATHDRLVSQIWECEERRDAAIAVFVEAMMRRDPPLLRG